MAFWANERPTFETPLSLISKPLPPCQVCREPQYGEVSQTDSIANDPFVGLNIRRTPWTLLPASIQNFETKIGELPNMLENKGSQGYNYSEGDVSARIHANMLMLVAKVIQGLVGSQMARIKVILDGLRISHLYDADYKVHIRAQASSKGSISDFIICLEPLRSRLQIASGVTWTPLLEMDQALEKMLTAMRTTVRQRGTARDVQWPSCVLAVVEVKRPKTIWSNTWTDWLYYIQDAKVKPYANLLKVLIQLRRYTWRWKTPFYMVSDYGTSVAFYVSNPGYNAEAAMEGMVLSGEGKTGPRYMLTYMCSAALSQGGFFKFETNLRNFANSLPAQR